MRLFPHDEYCWSLQKHFEQQKINVDIPNDDDKTHMMLDRFLKGEIDIKIFKRTLDLLHKKEEGFAEVGYV